MKVTVKKSDDRELVLCATLDELHELFQATREGRRTRRERDALEQFGAALATADPDLAVLIAADIEQQSKERQS